MSYFIEFLGISAVVGTLVLLLIAPFAMLALAIVLIAAVVTLLVLVAAIVAAPVLLVRAAHRRWEHRRDERVEDRAFAATATVSHAS